jgi:hypothetical protein
MDLPGLWARHPRSDSMAILLHKVRVLRAFKSHKTPAESRCSNASPVRAAEMGSNRLRQFAPTRKSGCCFYCVSWND